MDFIPVVINLIMTTKVPLPQQSRNCNAIHDLSWTFVVFMTKPNQAVRPVNSFSHVICGRSDDKIRKHLHFLLYCTLFKFEDCCSCHTHHSNSSLSWSRLKYSQWNSDSSGSCRLLTSQVHVSLFILSLMLNVSGGSGSGKTGIY